MKKELNFDINTKNEKEVSLLKQFMAKLDELRKEETSEEKPKEEETEEPKEEKEKFLRECQSAGHSEESCLNSWTLFVARRNKEPKQNAEEDKVVSDVRRASEQSVQHKGDVSKLILNMPVQELMKLEVKRPYDVWSRERTDYETVENMRKGNVKFDKLCKSFDGNEPFPLDMVDKLDKTTMDSLANWAKMKKGLETSKILKRSVVTKSGKKVINTPLDFTQHELATNDIETLLRKAGMKFVE